MSTGSWLAAVVAVGFSQMAVAQTTATDSALSKVQRICVDKLGGAEPLAGAVREMAFAALFAAKRFTVVEKCEKAEATLKGAVIDSAERRERAESEGISFGGIAGGASASGGVIAGATGGTGESLASSETRRHATVALRLVDADGTVIWAVTQDSGGGKNKAAPSDAIDRAIRQLIRDASRPAEGGR